jgi:hypothetical protein
MRHRSAALSFCCFALATGALFAMTHAAGCSATIWIAATEIGPAGGTVEGPGGTQVVIPPGALTEPTAVSIGLVAKAAAPALPGGLAYAGEVYAFQPHGLAFDAPVEIRLPVAPGVGNPAVLHASCPPGGSGATGCGPWDAAVANVSFQDGYALVSSRGFSLYAAASQLGGDAGGSGGAGGSSGTASSGGADAGGSSDAGSDGCAACSGNEECDGTGHCVEVMASGLGSPAAIAVDATSVYWASGDGTVMKCAVGGCGQVPTTLATGQVSPMSITVGGAYAYWWNHGMAGVDGSIMRCAVGGCGGVPAALATNTYVLAIAVTSSALYFTEDTPMGSTGGLLMSCPLGGCSGMPSQVAQVPGVPFALVVSGGSLVWASDGTSSQPSTAMKCTPPTCAPTTLVSGPPVSIRQMAADSASIYWTNADFSVMTCPLGGCVNLKPITLAALGGGANIPAAIASDGTNVYFTVIAMGGTPAVMKCAVGGCNGQPTVIASGPKIMQPNGIAVDATSVYWTDAAGTVMKSTK